MKTFKISFCRELRDVEVSVSNYSSFIRCMLDGNSAVFNLKVSDDDLPRLKKFLVKYADDKSSNHGRWYAHCNTYLWDCIIYYNGNFQVNTAICYRTPQRRKF